MPDLLLLLPRPPPDRPTTPNPCSERSSSVCAAHGRETVMCTHGEVAGSSSSSSFLSTSGMEGLRRKEGEGGKAKRKTHLQQKKKKLFPPLLFSVSCPLPPPPFLFLVRRSLHHLSPLASFTFLLLLLYDDGRISSLLSLARQCSRKASYLGRGDGGPADTRREKRLSLFSSVCFRMPPRKDADRERRFKSIRPSGKKGRRRKNIGV